MRGTTPLCGAWRWRCGPAAGVLKITSWTHRKLQRARLLVHLRQLLVALVAAAQTNTARMCDMHYRLTCLHAVSTPTQCQSSTSKKENDHPLGRPVEPLSGVPRLAHVAVPEVAGAGSGAVQPGLGTWRLGGRDVRPDRVVCWAGSRSPSLLESLLASLDEVLGSGLALAERLGAMTGMGSRGRYTRQRPPPQPPKNPPRRLAFETHGSCFAHALRTRRKSSELCFMQPT